MKNKIIELGFEIIFFDNQRDLTYAKNSWLRHKGTFLNRRISGSETKSMEFDVKYFELPVKLTKDDFYTFKYGFSMKKNHKFYKIFKNSIQKLFEAGITNKFNTRKTVLDKQMNIEDPNSQWKLHDKVKELSPLSLIDLKSGFVIWFIAVIIATLVFLGEIITYHFKILIQKRRNLTRVQNFVA